MFYYNILLLFILGLLVGSFLSVVISRLDTKEGFLKGRSRCPKCKAKILAKDLVPIFSYLILKGKCRKCGENISLFYPIIEITTGFLFALTYIRFYDVLGGPNLYLFLLLHFFIISVLLVIFAFDSVNYLIPDKIVIPSIIVVFIFSCMNILLNPTLGSDFLLYRPFLVNLIWGVIIGGGFFASLVLISSEKWMGWGDVKLGVFLGIALGYPLILVTIFSSFIIGTLYSLALIVLKMKTRKDIIPFGPFLVLGAFVAIFLGKYILNWYLGI